MDNPYSAEEGRVAAMKAWLYAMLMSLVDRNAEHGPNARWRMAFGALAADQRAQARGNLVSLVIGIAVAVIVGVGVAIPIVNDVLNSSNVSGLTATIVGFIPVMLGVLIFVATVGPIMQRT